MAKFEYRVPRAETERIAEAFAEHFGIDPESVPCDFQRGRIEVRVEELAALLGVDFDEVAFQNARQNDPLEWRRAEWLPGEGGLPERFRLLHGKLESVDGRFKIAERIREPGYDGWPLFDGGEHVSTHRLLRDAKTAAEEAMSR